MYEHPFESNKCLLVMKKRLPRLYLSPSSFGLRNSVNNRLGFWGHTTSLVIGDFYNPNEGMQFEFKLSYGWSLFMTLDAGGINFITDKSGSNHKIGGVQWTN